jgi:hypothetical protein
MRRLALTACALILLHAMPAYAQSAGDGAGYGLSDSVWTPQPYSLQTTGGPGSAPTTTIETPAQAKSTYTCTPTTPSTTLGACTPVAAGSKQGTQLRRTVDACGKVSMQTLTCTIEGDGKWVYLYYRTTGTSLTNTGFGYKGYERTCIPSSQATGFQSVYKMLPDTDCPAPMPRLASCYTPVIDGGRMPEDLYASACDGSAPFVMAQDWDAQWCWKNPGLCR